MELINLISTVHLTGFKYFNMRFFQVKLKVNINLPLEVTLQIPMSIIDWHACLIHLCKIQRGRQIEWEVRWLLVTINGTDQSMPGLGQTSSRHAVISKTKIMIPLNLSCDLLAPLTAFYCCVYFLLMTVSIFMCCNGVLLLEHYYDIYATTSQIQPGKIKLTSCGELKAFVEHTYKYA